MIWDNLIQDSINFPQIQKPSSSSWCQKGKMKPTPYRGATFLEWPVNLTLLWHFLLSACELIFL